MKISVTEKNEQTIISLDGMLDSSTAPQFQEAVARQLEKSNLNLAVDLSELSYTSSQGIRTFLTLIKTVAARKGKLVFRNIQPSVREVFEMSGLLQAMTVE